MGLTAEEAKKLTHLYGTNVNKVYEIIRERGNQAQRYGLTKAVFASLVYGIEEEMVTSPVDYFNRRTGAIFFDIHWVKEWKEPVLTYMKERCQWKYEHYHHYKQRLNEEIKYATTPVEELGNLPKLSIIGMK